MPQISVVIPVYNAQKTLEKCLSSIFNQTDKNFEIIAVNDGSTDNSLSILKKYQDKITIINQQNLGAAKARNVGSKIAAAPFIIFCDADIVMEPTMLETMYNALQKHPKAAFAYSSFKYGFKTFKLWPYNAKKLKQMPYIHTTSLIRKDLFPGFDPKLTRFQDWDLFLTMAKRGDKGIWIDKILFQVKAGGTMSSWLPKFLYSFSSLKKVKKYKEAEKIIKEKHNL